MIAQTIWLGMLVTIGWFLHIQSEERWLPQETEWNVSVWEVLPGKVFWDGKGRYVNAFVSAVGHTWVMPFESMEENLSGRQYVVVQVLNWTGEHKLRFDIDALHAGGFEDGSVEKQLGELLINAGLEDDPSLPDKTARLLVMVEDLATKPMTRSPDSRVAGWRLAEWSYQIESGPFYRKAAIVVSLSVWAAGCLLILKRWPPRKPIIHG